MFSSLLMYSLQYIVELFVMNDFESCLSCKWLFQEVEHALGSEYKLSARGASSPASAWRSAHTFPTLMGREITGQPSPPPHVNSSSAQSVQ